MSRINKVWFDELMLVRYMGPYKSTHIAALQRELRHRSRRAKVVELAAVHQLVNCSLSTAVSYDMLIVSCVLRLVYCGSRSTRAVEPAVAAAACQHGLNLACRSAAI